MRRAVPRSSFCLLAAGALAQDETPPSSCPLTPRATEVIAVGAGQVRVEYARRSRGTEDLRGPRPVGPSVADRTNAATTLKTNVDVKLGDVVEPRKGTYTLYTLPAKGRGG